jgi:SWI2/SNF2 ATPase-like protein
MAPNASFIGVTSTPIEKSDANTRSGFGDYISIYDIQRAVEEKATGTTYDEGHVRPVTYLFAPISNSESPAGPRHASQWGKTLPWIVGATALRKRIQRKMCLFASPELISSAVAIPSTRHTERAIISSSSVRMTRTVARLAFVQITPQSPLCATNCVPGVVRQFISSDGCLCRGVSRARSR